MEGKERAMSPPPLFGGSLRLWSLALFMCHLKATFCYVYKNGKPVCLTDERRRQCECYVVIKRSAIDITFPSVHPSVCLQHASTVKKQMQFYRISL